MDYTTAPLLFRLRKALRYLSLYGVSRTLEKIAGQYHVRASYKKMPENHRRSNPGAHVGVLGCGNFAFSNIAYLVM